MSDRGHSLEELRQQLAEAEARRAQIQDALGRLDAAIHDLQMDIYEREIGLAMEPEQRPASPSDQGQLKRDEQ